MSEQSTHIGKELGQRLEELAAQIGVIDDAKALDLSIAMNVYALGFKVGSFDVAIGRAMQDAERAEVLRSVIAEGATGTD